MRKPKTHFEQVSVEIVKKIAKIDRPKDEERTEDKVTDEKSRRPNSVRRRCAPERVTLVKDEMKERWKVLCEQAANEQNPQRLMVLVAEITQLLDQKHNRLQQQMFTAPEDSRQENLKGDDAQSA